METEKMEYIKCNLCNSDNYILYWEQPDKRFLTTPRHNFTLVKCNCCGLIYLNPRPKKQYINEFYCDAFYKQFTIEQGKKKTFLNNIAWALDIQARKELKAVKEKVSIILKNHPNCGKLLDVGCASGDFLHEMKALNWSVLGVDISQEMCNQVKTSFGIECIKGDFNNLNFPPDYFDAITFWASLEHLYNPKEAIKISQRILRKGGIIAILVPNSKSLEERILKRVDPNPVDIPRHLYHFNEEILDKMLTENGFIKKDVRNFTLNAPDRFTRILSRYIDLIKPEGISSKAIRLIGSNISIIFGDFISIVLSVFRRSHTIIIVGEKI